MVAALRQIGLVIAQPEALRAATLGRNLVRLLVVCLLGGPVLAGLAFTLLPAFGYLPSIGATWPSLDAWRGLLATPGLTSSLRVSLSTGLAATALALALAFGLCASTHGRFRGRTAGLIAPMLAVPHGAFAIGLAFLLAPSGWLFRLSSPWLTGYASPPDVATIQDDWGVALVVGLLAKEIPFFVVVIFAALNQIPVAQHARVGRSLGYNEGMIWFKVIAPQVYSQIRLPIYVVLAYAASVVDMALVLAPSNPPTLAVAAVRLLTSPDVANYLPGAAAATLQLALVAVAILIWRLGERMLSQVGLWWIGLGRRGVATAPGLRILAVAALLVVALGFGALLALGVWSVAWRWPFPDALPTTWSLEVWRRHLNAAVWPMTNTIALAGSTTVIALALAIVWLELDDQLGERQASVTNPLYLSLVVPQIAFLFGVQVLAVSLSIDGTFLAVAWSHLIFVFPYVLLSLSDPWQALDPRYARAAASLGAAPLRTLALVKLPLLLRPILAAASIGFAVSAAQYLPTLFLGGGRVATLATESLAMVSGGDRRVVGVLALLQAVIPFFVYVAALVIPNLVASIRHSAGEGSQ